MFLLHLINCQITHTFCVSVINQPTQFGRLANSVEKTQGNETY